MHMTYIIVLCLVYIIGLPLTLLKIKHKEKYNYQCSKCSHIFEPFGTELESYSFFGELRVKCPKCGKYSAVKYVKKE